MAGLVGPGYPPRGNLYFSLLLRPELPPYEVMQLTFVAALAVAEAIFQTMPAGTAITCKWPNDILISGKKVAGILLSRPSTAAEEWTA